MTDEGAIKLLGLADFLEQDVAAAQKRSGRKKLRMERWFDAGNTKLKQPSLESEGCGTSACALGWATVAFPRSGLKIYLNPCNGSCGNKSCEIVDERVMLEDAEGFDAARIFFDITQTESRDLFSSHMNEKENSVKEVVSRLRRFVAQKWEEVANERAQTV